jgi:hypothetical protein
MDQMKLHIEQVVATREKEVVSTKEGYLLQMNDKSRVKSNWIRNWYVLRDGLFYCKVGKVPSSSCCFLFPSHAVGLA